MPRYKYSTHINRLEATAKASEHFTNRVLHPCISSAAKMLHDYVSFLVHAICISTGSHICIAYIHIGNKCCNQKRQPGQAGRTIHDSPGRQQKMNCSQVAQSSCYRAYSAPKRKLKWCPSTLHLHHGIDLHSCGFEIQALRMYIQESRRSPCPKVSTLLQCEARFSLALRKILERPWLDIKNHGQIDKLPTAVSNADYFML